MKKLLRKFPLIWVVAMFAILIAAWTILITIAAKHAPEQIEIERPKEEEHVRP